MRAGIISTFTCLSVALSACSSASAPPRSADSVATTTVDAPAPRRAARPPEASGAARGPEASDHRSRVVHVELPAPAAPGGPPRLRVSLENASNGMRLGLTLPDGSRSTRVVPDDRLGVEVTAEVPNLTREAVVVLAVDAGVAYDTVVAVMDALRGKGFSNFVLESL